MLFNRVRLLQQLQYELLISILLAFQSILPRGHLLNSPSLLPQLRLAPHHRRLKLNPLLHPLPQLPLGLVRDIRLNPELIHLGDVLLPVNLVSLNSFPVVCQNLLEVDSLILCLRCWQLVGTLGLGGPRRRFLSFEQVGYGFVGL